jgi:hypothetical protein
MNITTNINTTAFAEPSNLPDEKQREFGTEVFSPAPAPYSASASEDRSAPAPIPFDRASYLAQLSFIEERENLKRRRTSKKGALQANTNVGIEPMSGMEKIMFAGYKKIGPKGFDMNGDEDMMAGNEKQFLNFQIVNAPAPSPEFDGPDAHLPGRSMFGADTAVTPPHLTYFGGAGQGIMAAGTYNSGPWASLMYASCMKGCDMQLKKDDKDACKTNCIPYLKATAIARPGLGSSTGHVPYLYGVAPPLIQKLFSQSLPSNDPAPTAAMLFKGNMHGEMENLGDAAMRLGETYSQPLGDGNRPVASAMRYAFAGTPPMLPEQGEGEQRMREQI